MDSSGKKPAVQPMRQGKAPGMAPNSTEKELTFFMGVYMYAYREMQPQAARRVMFSSYIYLPVVLLALLADKI